MRLGEYEAAAEHLVSMGNYENVKLISRALVIADENDDPEEVMAFAREIVEKGLRPHLERAIETTADADSYVETWVDGPPPPPPPTRKRRVARS
ncbi:hypothetical protein GCM10010149_89000 [Nonomuraea roseoviolacea subsp. roseoviolacea]|uniref:hypothetical protein n=1 Tax=Nonomuraea roseoviolacea TaxID=103837 RepID=UPI0031D15722